MRHQLRNLTALSVTTALLLAACGGADGAASDSGSANSAALTYSDSDRDTYLVDCAKKEGSLTWYTSLAGDVIDEMIADFTETYPGIAVDTYRGEQTDIVARVYQETQADRLQGDMVEVTSDAFRQLAEMEVIAPFSSPVTADSSDRFTLKNDDGEVLGIGDRASYVSFAYNTDEIPEADVPKTLDDLLSPNLKGKLALTDSTTGVRFMGNILEAKGEEAGTEFIEKLGEQDVRIEAVSGSALAGLISTGEAMASPGIFRNHAEQYVADGAPVKWVPLEPVTANVGYVGVFAGAEHPCAAMLLLDMLLGESGGKIYSGLQYPRPDDDLGFDSWVPDETFTTTEDYNDAFMSWQDLFEQNFR